ncbi:MAG: cysteine desulfurase [Firmicutes bacterium]|nr:cysteine desulfurase [Bacillota bacterium]
MIYLDNSATTKQYSQVTQLMVQYMEEDFGNPSSLYQLGVDAEKAIKNARKQMTKAMGVTAGSVFFTSCGTESDNAAIFGAARALKRQGNKIVTSAVEHPAVLECCKRLEQEGFEVVYVGVDDKCRLDESQLEHAIDDRTILVTLMHVNNEVGTVLPVGKVRDLMDRKKSPGYFHSDCVQSFGKLHLPAKADMISVSGHKIHGPKGTGALYVRKNLNLPAYLLGGGQEEGRRSGTQNVAGIAGFGLAAELTANSRSEEVRRMTEIRQKLVDGFKAGIKDIVINSPEECGEAAGQCCPSVLNVTFKGTRGEVLLHTLEQEGIYVSTGSACSSNKKGQSHVLDAMGLKPKDIEGTLRFSLGRFNTLDETEEVIEKVTAAVNRFRRLGSFR